MQVIKRNGEKEPCSFDKITARIAKLCTDLPIDPTMVTQRVVAGVIDGIHTHEIDDLAAETAAYMATTHHAYGTLAGRIAASNLQKDTNPSFYETMKQTHKGNKELFSEEFMSVIRENRNAIDKAIEPDRDFAFDYFGFQTLIRSYLLKVVKKVAETPQDMWMRVAVGIHCKDKNFDLKDVMRTYEGLSMRRYTHATPTLFNAGLKRSQMSSCFLVKMKEDSVDGIYDTLKQCALISKTAGGIGIAAHEIRATGAPINGTNGVSNGIVPMLRVFDATARYIDQGGGKRKGSIAFYYEPWHADMIDFLNLKRNHGKEESKARDLFYGLWVSDLFMKRLDEDGLWTFFSPDSAPGLNRVWGAEFEALYEKYEAEGKGIFTMKAQEFWKQVGVACIETGTPYIMYKDACNGKSNQQHLGTIECSNLCTEIVQFTSKDEVAVCNLASISLPAFIGSSDNWREYDWEGFMDAARDLTYNLNKVIDGNYYPVPEARYSNLKHRPIGVGVQGLADVFASYSLPFDSPEAREMDQQLFEYMYYGCLDASCTLAEKHGHYESYPGSPFSKGILQMDMWPDGNRNLKLDWAPLRARIAKFGTRNSLLTTVMPTASTAQILGNNECIEAFTSNIYSRRTLAGDFFVVNKWLVRDLEKIGMWNKQTQDAIIAGGGSVQNVPGIPDHLKSVYRTVWEIPQRSVVEMAAARGRFIDQSQSLNIHMTNPSYAKFASLQRLVWKLGLKGTYYLRIQTLAKPIQFTVDKEKAKVHVGDDSNPKKRPRPSEGEDDGGGKRAEEECLMCSA